MTINFSVGDDAAVDLAAEAETYYREAAEDLTRVIRKIKAGKLGPADAKAAGPAIRDLKAAFYMALDERNKVEKLRKTVSGVVGTRPIDFQSARDEIGRRLACLRDARSGG